MIRLSDVTLNIGNKKVLENINVAIEKGQFIGVIGANASGKTSLLKLLNGIYLPDEGEVTVEGINTKEKSTIFEVRRKVGLVLQNPENQIIAPTVEEDIVFGMENLGFSKEKMEKNLTEILNFTGLTEKRYSYPNHLSGGQKQRLAIASVLVMEPDYMIMDEPTSMLDDMGCNDIMMIVNKLLNSGKTVVAASHNLEEFRNADRLIYLKEGKILLDEAPEIVFELLRETSDVEVPA